MCQERIKDFDDGGVQFVEESKSNFLLSAGVTIMFRLIQVKT